MRITSVNVAITAQIGNVVKAYASILIDNCMAIKNIRIIKRENGYLMAMPSRKLDDKYEDTKWLGSLGQSNNNTEWAVSYHGTKIYCAEPIAKEGLKPGVRNAYGVGVYCTPNISTAEKYAEVFTSPTTHKKYKIVFQNRVKPCSIIKCKSKGGPDDYWYVEDGKDIRPYSICIKEVK